MIWKGFWVVPLFGSPLESVGVAVGGMGRNRIVVWVVGRGSRFALWCVWLWVCALFSTTIPVAFDIDCLSPDDLLSVVTVVAMVVVSISILLSIKIGL